MELENRSQYKISKTKLAGSYGKRTCIISSDIDLVIFMKDVHPPFDRLLKEFESILKSMGGTDKSNRITNMRRTRNLLQFDFDGYEFDLVPATDFISEPNLEAREELMLQQDRALNEMVWWKLWQFKRARIDYSSSLTFSAVDFMKNQSSFTHDIVRLAKYWYKSVCILEYIPGAKYAIELIAVDAANKVEGRRDYTHFDAFIQFLHTIRHFGSMNIVFDYTFAGINQKHWPSKKANYVRLIDPANPYNNLAEGFLANKSVIEVLRNHAARTMNNFQNYWPNHLADRVLSPKFIVDSFRPGIFGAVKNRTIHVSRTSEFRIYPLGFRNITIREHRHVTDSDRRLLEFMYIYLMSLCQQLDGKIHLGLRANFIDELLNNLSEQQIFRDKKFDEMNKCENFDVTFCLKAPRHGAFCLSFCLEDYDSQWSFYKIAFTVIVIFAILFCVKQN